MVIAKFRRASPQGSQKICRRQWRTIRQNQPSSTKKPRTMVPPPQSARIMQRYIGGASIREIAREEQRDRATVTKIVRSDEMQTFVQKMRERFYGLGSDALDAVQHALQKEKDGRLGRQILEDIGVVPSPAERYAMATQPMSINKSDLTPFEAAMTEGLEGQMGRLAYGAACAIEVSSECYGFPLPTPEEVRHLGRVAEVADEITEGRFQQICMTDGPEEKRIRQLAEKKVKREEARRSLAPRRAQRALPLSKHVSIARRGPF